MNVSMILSGGSGSRFGGELPKQYQLLAGKEIIAYSVEAMKKSTATDCVIIVAGSESTARLSETHGVTCIEGGATRNESLKKGLDFIRENHPSCEKILINEAARPLITADLVDRYFEYLDKYDAVITTQHITASLGREGEHVTDRDEYYLIQAPEAFSFPLLYRYFKADSPITATNQQLSFDSKVYRNFEFRNNFKITYPEDLVIAEQLMRCSKL